MEFAVGWTLTVELATCSQVEWAAEETLAEKWVAGETFPEVCAKREALLVEWATVESLPVEWVTGGTSQVECGAGETLPEVWAAGGT